MMLAMNRHTLRLAPIAISVIALSTAAFGQTPASGSGGPLIASGNSGAESCSHSPICAWGRGRDTIIHEFRKPDLGFTFAYPFALPEGLTGGVSAVALNSK